MLVLQRPKISGRETIPPFWCYSVFGFVVSEQKCFPIKLLFELKASNNLKFDRDYMCIMCS